MNIYKSALFPYIAGDSLVEKTVTMTMTDVKAEQLPSRNGGAVEKLTLGFQESPKRLVLNKTNARRIADAYGGETDAWRGQQIELYSEKIQAFGQDHNAVRVRAVNGAGKAQGGENND